MTKEYLKPWTLYAPSAGTYRPGEIVFVTYAHWINPETGNAEQHPITSQFFILLAEPLGDAIKDWPDNMRDESGDWENITEYYKDSIRMLGSLEDKTK